MNDKKPTNAEKATSAHRLKFNKQCFRDFWHLLKPYWKSEEKWSAFGLLALNILCIIIEVRASVAINDYNKDFFDALQNFDTAAMITCLWHFVVAIAILLLTFGYAVYFNGLLSIRWRRWLTKHYLNNWLTNHNHYRLTFAKNNIDNPDQRISEDLEKFPDTTLTAFFLLFQSFLTLGSFGYILWSLSGSLTVPLGSWQLTIPGYLCWAALLYAVIGTWITGWLGKKLSSLDYQQQRYNADFRFSLIRLREASEQVALYKGETAENNKLYHLFDHIFENFIKIISLRKRLTFFNNGYNSAASILGLVISLPLYFAKKIHLGVMMQIAGAFGQVVSACAVLMNSFTLFAEWRAIIHRLTEFKHLIEEQPQQTEHTKIIFQTHAHRDIKVNNLALVLPEGKSLISDINLVLHAGGRFLLNGKSGLGKSTFLRALAGLWPYGNGTIHFPENINTLFLPQKPYLPQGTLKDALLYPHNLSTSDEELAEILKICHLEKFQTQLNEPKNWAKDLSLGEQQLIAFARIFLSKPDIIFLDEATSALDESTENHIYQQLRTQRPDATIVSVGHRHSLHKFHSHVINFCEDMSEKQIGLVVP